MWMLVFSYIPFEGWVIGLDVHDLLDGPINTMYLPAYDGEVVHTDRITHGLAALIDERGGS